MCIHAHAYLYVFTCSGASHAPSRTTRPSTHLTTSRRRTWSPLGALRDGRRSSVWCSGETAEPAPMRARATSNERHNRSWSSVRLYNVMIRVGHTFNIWLDTLRFTLFALASIDPPARVWGCALSTFRYFVHENYFKVYGFKSVKKAVRKS